MSKMSRRKFVGMTSAAVAAAYLPWRFGARAARAFAKSPGIKLFGTQLRDIKTIGVAAPDKFVAPITGVTHYTINITQYQDQITGGALGATTLRGYNPTRLLIGQNNRHLGGIIVAQSGVPIQLTFRNNLPPGYHILPNDLTLMGADLGADRTAVHFHGGLVPWISDGGPFDWWDPSGRTGLSFLNNRVLNPGAAANEAEYYYPLNQTARFGWYHDHAVGITRINAYAGIASALLIRDLFEQNLMNLGLPQYIEAGGNEIPLVIQDKIFVGEDTALQDPTWGNLQDPAVNEPGSLWYAHVYEPAKWELASTQPPPDPSCIPEFFGDTMLVNGTTFPTVAVEPRRYRLRFLNACNARFLNLQLYVSDKSANGITLDGRGSPKNRAALCDPTAPGTSAKVMQIGTEGGFLAYPALVPTNVPFNPKDPLNSSLVVAPAERPDLVIDFSAHAGESIILYNDAPAPFPSGDPAADYFPGLNTKANPTNAFTQPGYGPNTRILMRFEVQRSVTAPADPPFKLQPQTYNGAGIDAPIVPWDAIRAGVPVPPGYSPRTLTLNETFDGLGRLIQMLGTLTPPRTLADGFGQPYMATPTEVVQNGATEVWEIYNTTGDVHPMHFHLANVQVLNRQPYDANGLATTGVPVLTGPATPPRPNELGWKETVMMFPGTVTRVIMKFDLSRAAIRTASGRTLATPSSPRTGGAEYVWHCHILEHEEHDMMRPLVVM